MTRCKQEMDMSGLDSALGDLVAAQIGLGKELLGVLVKGSGQLVDSALGMELPKGSACCDIPEPCWMPKSLGEVCCNLCPGDVGEVCLTIENGDFQPKIYEVSAAGPDAQHAGIAANDRTFQLGPKERRVVAVKVVMPMPNPDGSDNDRTQSCCDCDCLDLLIWVKGCANHYLRWEVCRGKKKSKTCCHHIDVLDAPDYELHWYDHFHIMRPCVGHIKT